MPTIWFCPGCRVGVRVPDGAPGTRAVFRCPKCLTRITLDDRGADTPNRQDEDIEVFVDLVPELEPAEPEEAPRWLGTTPPRRHGPAEPARRPARPRARKRRQEAVPVWVWLIAAGVGLLAVLLVIGAVIFLTPASRPTPAASEPAGKAAEPRPPQPLPAEAAPVPRITEETIARIKNGLSQAQVEEILGAPGRVLRRFQGEFGPEEGKEFKSVRWEDGQGNSIQLTFHDDQVVDRDGKDD